MTVSELIEALQTLDPGLEILRSDYEEGHIPLSSLRLIDGFDTKELFRWSYRGYIQGPKTYILIE